jgi:hypothetical protein
LLAQAFLAQTFLAQDILAQAASASSLNRADLMITLFSTFLSFPVTRHQVPNKSSKRFVWRELANGLKERAESTMAGGHLEGFVVHS